MLQEVMNPSLLENPILCLVNPILIVEIYLQLFM
jgi:hypothetical protein